MVRIFATDGQMRYLTQTTVNTPFFITVSFPGVTSKFRAAINSLSNKNTGLQEARYCIVLSWLASTEGGRFQSDELINPTLERPLYILYLIFNHGSGKPSPATASVFADVGSL